MNSVAGELESIPSRATSICNRSIGGAWNDGQSSRIKEELCTSVTRECRPLKEKARGLYFQYSDNVENAESLLKEAKALLAGA